MTQPYTKDCGRHLRIGLIAGTSNVHKKQFKKIGLRERRPSIGEGGFAPVIQAAGETAGTVLLGAIVVLLIWRLT